MESTIGGRIAQLRRELAARLRRDVFQPDLARMLETTPATVSRWEADLSEPKADALLRMARLFGVTPEYLLYGNSGGSLPLQPEGVIPPKDAIRVPASKIQRAPTPDEREAAVARRRRKDAG